jgi:S-phase kinase-associated protein 1
MRTSLASLLRSHSDVLPLTARAVEQNYDVCMQPVTLQRPSVRLMMHCDNEFLSLSARHPVCLHAGALRAVLSLADLFDTEDLSVSPTDSVSLIFSCSGPSYLLQRIMEYSKHYSGTPFPTIQKPLASENMAENSDEFSGAWVDSFTQEELFLIITMCNSLQHSRGLDLGCAAVAAMIKNKTPEEIRQHFNIVNDFTPEEEAQVREENKWCEE